MSAWNYCALVWIDFYVSQKKFIVEKNGMPASDENLTTNVREPSSIECFIRERLSKIYRTADFTDFWFQCTMILLKLKAIVAIQIWHSASYNVYLAPVLPVELSCFRGKHFYELDSEQRYRLATKFLQRTEKLQKSFLLFVESNRKKQVSTVSNFIWGHLYTIRFEFQKFRNALQGSDHCAFLDEHSGFWFFYFKKWG